MNWIDKAFAWTWAVLAAFLLGVFLGPLGIGVLDNSGALTLLAVGVVAMAIAGSIAIKRP